MIDDDRWFGFDEQRASARINDIWRESKGREKSISGLFCALNPFYHCKARYKNRDLFDLFDYFVLAAQNTQHTHALSFIIICSAGTNLPHVWPIAQK